MAVKRYARGRGIHSQMRLSSVRGDRTSSPVGFEGLERRTLFAAIFGTVFNDLNGDGLRQDGEGGLSNWRVYIDGNANNAFDEGERSALTNGDGRYTINELAAGTYRVREVVKAGFTRTAPGGNGTHEITVGADGEEDVHFGNQANEAGAELAGRVFNDLNGDGARQDGEAGLANRTVYLDQNNNGKRDEGERAAATDAGGFYAFENLDAGTYRVRQVVPEGWELTSPEGGFHLVEVEAGHTVEGLRFGNREVGDPPPPADSASIRGFVFNDLNGNGTRQDGEPALAGWLIYLDQNNNGQRDEGERAAETGANGNYAFEDLPAGTYRVREVLRDGWTIVRPGDGFYVVTLEAGQTANERIFANRREEEPQPPPQDSGVLRGVVFNDVNGDGVWQDGEPGLASRTVYLDQNNNGQRDEGEHAATTNANGGYAFEALAAGTYHVRHVLLSGWTMTAPAGGVYTVELAAGQTVDGLRFGNRHNEEPPPPGEHSASIRGVVFNDVNGDGNRNEGEPPLAGWVVYLDQNRNGQRDEGEHAAVTNAEGRYAFEELPAGEYRVREVVQDGWTVIRPESGFYDIALANGQAANERIFANRHNTGEQPPAASASIRGVVFNDRNGNGTREDGEAGLAGRLVFLDQNENGHRDEGERAAETHSDGRYAFEGLAAGSYRVVQVVPAGWTVIRPAEGFYDLELIDGQRADDTHFANRHNEQDGPPVGEPPGEEPDGEIVGEVFDDADADGVRDAGEAGVARARVFVDVNGNGRRDRREVRAVTDASGAYRLAGVPAGDHVVKHVAPKGFRAVAAGEGAAVSVTAGGSAAAGGFAVTRKSLLQGTVFQDASGNRALDAGEGGQAGLVMFLDLNRNNAADAGEPTVLTDAAGRYSFLVDRGGYRVGVLLPDGWRSSSARDGLFQVKIGSGRVVERDVAYQPA
jgi:serine-aspartate repeat-containing protein C/D/E